MGHSNNDFQNILNIIFYKKFDRLFCILNINSINR